MRAGKALASLLARHLVAPSRQQGALKQLQRGLATQGPFTSGYRAAGAAAAGRAPWLVAVAAGLSAGLGAQLVSSTGGEPAECKAAEKPKVKEFDREEVAKHRTKETGGAGGLHGPLTGTRRGVGQQHLCRRVPVPSKRASNACCD